MKKLLSTVSAAAATVGFGVVIISPAQAEPFIPCPYDPAVPGAQMQYFNQKTAEIVAMQNAVNTKVLGPLTGPERAAWAASPEGLAEVARERQVVQDRDHPPLACFSLQPVAAAPELNPPPLQPVPGSPLIDDIQSGPDSEVAAPVDCTKLRGAYDALGPVADSADAAAKLNHLKIPGISQVTGTSLALCGLDAIPAAIANPSQGNQQRVFDGACGAVDQFTGGIINPCGDTPVGSH